MDFNSVLDEGCPVAVVMRARKGMPSGIARKLWVKSGGRCEYIGCNMPL